jgi:hypothetical protein
MGQHIHRYHRINIARKGNPKYWVMQCNLPHCTHYTQMATKVSAPSMVGKISICNKCQQQFELTRKSLQKAKPICDDCIASPVKDKVKSANKFFEEMEKGILTGTGDN